VTIGEDPAFGREYFLRADRLTAGLRWSGFLRGRFEFGTLSLSRPSLILARNDAGSWNLERWLPPAKRNSGDALVYGPQPAPTPANRLQKIDIDEGRVNFKVGDEKLPFAFLGVSGSVEQVSAGRWQLQLEAEPWRSGVTLQSAGTLMVHGDVAGTSARLQPARIEVHWEKVSVADLFRLVSGQDYGLRGSFALDATARSGVAEVDSAPLQPGDWAFSVQARAAEIHRWDLTERGDNPGVNVNVEGTWNVPRGIMTARDLDIETTGSNLRGSALVSSSASPSWQVRVDSAGIQAADLLSWYRAFHPEVDNGLSIEQFITGAMTVRGWPLELTEAAFSSNGGEVRVPTLNSLLRIGVFQGGRERDTLAIEPIRVSYGPILRNQAGTRAAASGPKRRNISDGKGVVDVSLSHDFQKRASSISIHGRVEKVEDVLSVAAAFGRPLNHGWSLRGPATAALHWDWESGQPHGRWNGRVDVSNGVLEAAGLNKPLQLNKVKLEWRDNLRSSEIADVDGFGTSWSGKIIQSGPPETDGNTKWNFQLHANHLDATVLDLWIGPRARPNWLQRLLPSLFGGATPSASPPASALVRRINAEGELRIDEFDLEKIKLSHVRAQGSLRDLHLEVRDADAQWSGGRVRAKLRASFLPRPSYDLTAELDRVDLAQLPPSGHSPERFAGLASGTLHLVTQGVGRDELLDRLAGKGEVRLHNVEFRGWDVSASVAEGEPREGASRWTAGEASFTLRDRSLVLGALRLEAGTEKTLVKGTVSFSQDTDLTMQTSSDAQGENHAPERHVLKISGPLELPRVSIEKLVARQPAD
jgi:hypothetical protein